MPLHLALSISLSFDWHPVIRLPSQDTKQSLIESGQGTASVPKPCLGCDMTKEDFEYPPTYFYEIDPEFPAQCLQRWGTPDRRQGKCEYNSAI
jgi:hypothetical protein